MLLPSFLTSSFSVAKRTISAWAFSCALTLVTTPIAFAQLDAFSSATTAEDRAIRIGILNFEGETSYAGTRDKVQEQMVEYLRKQFPNDRVEPHYYTTPELTEAVRNGKVEFFLASSGFYVAMQHYGVRDVATLVSNYFSDPNRVVSGTIFVRKDREDLTDIASLQKSIAVSTHPMNFMTYQIGMGEIAKRGYDPDRFFRQTLFTDNSPVNVVRIVFEGKADVGLLRHCMLENISERFPEFKNQFRVIEPKNHAYARCASSTDLYPGWTMAVTPHTPPNMTHKLALSLLAMTPKDTPSGYTWTLATDFKRVNDVLRDLRVGPYAYLRDWTLTRIIRELWPYLGFVVGLLVAGVFHFLQVRRLVDKRTAQLREALEREQAANIRAQEASVKIDLLQRLSAVGQLSSIFVHELGQPLSAMGYAVRGLETLAAREQKGEPLSERQRDNRAECVSTIRRQIQRCGAIIERVRSYARQQGTGRENAVNFCSTMREMAAELETARKMPACAQIEIPETPLIVEGNGVELGLVILNLLKNAADEIREHPTDNPVMRATLQSDSDKHALVLTVENSGRDLTDAEVQAMQVPFATTKGRGLGLGVIIVKSIAEAHRARVSFAPRKGGGLVARFEMALREEGLSEVEETTEKNGENKA